jgi:glutamate-1-semialdehyde aminotransferase
MDSTGVIASTPGGFMEGPRVSRGLRGKGGRCWDDEGNAYLDFICGYGSLVLGHSDDRVNRAACDQIAAGALFPVLEHSQAKLAQQLFRIFPHADRAQFFKTGSEAVAAAVRIARTYTRRELVVRAGFHGWHDQFVSPHVSWHRYVPDKRTARAVPGVPSVIEGLILRWDGRDVDALETLVKRAENRIAALVLDPVQLPPPTAQALGAIRALTRSHGVLLVLDEVKTAFRVHVGGVQGLCGITADITVLSKAIANGFPLSAVVGLASILEKSAATRVMGTYNNELVSIAAASETLGIIVRSSVPERLALVGSRLIDGVNAVLRHRKLDSVASAVPYHWPSMPFILFNQEGVERESIKQQFYSRLWDRGLWLLSNHMNFVCFAHDEADVDNALAIIDEAVQPLSR